MPHEIEYQLQTEIKRALADNTNNWSAQEQCNAIIDQARYTAPLSDSIAKSPAPVVASKPAASPKRGPTLLLLGILLVMMIIAIVAVSTLSTDTYDDGGDKE